MLKLSVNICLRGNMQSIKSFVLLSLFALLMACAHTPKSVSPGQWTPLGAGIKFRELPSANAKSMYLSQDKQKYRIITEHENWIALMDSEGFIGWMYGPKVYAALGLENKPGTLFANRGTVEQGEKTVRVARVDRRSNRRQTDRQTRQQILGRKKTIEYSFNVDVGFLSKTQIFKSAGVGVTGNYEIDKTAPALALLGKATKSFGRYRFGLAAELFRTINGTITTPTVVGERELNWTLADSNFRFIAEYRLKPSLFLAGRLGYHNSSLTVDPDDGVKLPGEKLSGATIGINLLAPRVRERLSMQIGVDTLLSGSLAQDPGFVDGESATVSGLYIHTAVQYQWTRTLSLLANWAYASESFDFKGRSDRNVDIVEGSREDSANMFGIGISRRF